MEYFRCFAYDVPARRMQAIENTSKNKYLAVLELSSVNSAHRRAFRGQTRAWSDEKIGQMGDRFVTDFLERLTDLAWSVSEAEKRSVNCHIPGIRTRKDIT